MKIRLQLYKIEKENFLKNWWDLLQMYLGAGEPLAEHLESILRIENSSVKGEESFCSKYLVLCQNSTITDKNCDEISHQLTAKVKASMLIDSEALCVSFMEAINDRLKRRQDISWDAVNAEVLDNGGKASAVGGGIEFSAAYAEVPEIAAASASAYDSSTSHAAASRKKKEMEKSIAEIAPGLDLDL